MPDPVDALTGQLRDGAPKYAAARCGLPGCGEPLSIVWRASRRIFLSDTADVLRDLAADLADTWHVECDAGHVILLPPDTGADSYAFGLCACDPDYPDPAGDSLCGHHDMARLSAAVMTEEITDTDPVAAYLDRIRPLALMPSAPTTRLFRAVEAVLALHRPENFVLGVKPCPVHAKWSGSLMAVIDDRRQCLDCVVTEYDTCGHCVDVDEGYNWRWPCPTYRAISAALTGTESTDGD